MRLIHHASLLAVSIAPKVDLTSMDLLIYHHEAHAHMHRSERQDVAIDQEHDGI